MAENVLKELAPGDLPVGEKLDANLYNGFGVLICKQGQILQRRHVTALIHSGVQTVYLGQWPAGGIVQADGLQPVNIKDIPLSRPLEHDIHDETGKVVMTQGQVFLRLDRDSMLRRGIRNLWVPATSSAANRQTTDRNDNDLGNSLDQILKSPETLVMRPAGEPLVEKVQRTSRRSAEQVTQAVAFRDEIFSFADDILHQLRGGKQLVAQEVGAMATGTIDRLYQDVNLFASIAGLIRQKNRHENSRTEHMVATYLNAMAIGTYLQFDAEQMSELAMCALLHDVGMVKVPQEILDKPGQLSINEKLTVQAHPMHGVNMLEQIRSIPEAVLLGIYQSHERIGGQGYPKGRTGRFIHDYAKIISVADTYAALRESRPHRDRLSPYQAMERVVKMTAMKLFDPRPVRALLCAVGLFPIGSWIRLADQRIARVVGIQGRGERIDRPQIAIIFDAMGRRLAEPIHVDLLQRPELRIDDALPDDYAPVDFTTGLAENPTL